MNDGSSGSTPNGPTHHDGPDRRERAQHFANEASAQVEQARLLFDDLNHRATQFIRARPGTALLGALALGWVVGKLASRNR